MTFIENIFGLSPDAGNGLLELLYLAMPVVALAAAWIVVRSRARRRRSRAA